MIKKKSSQHDLVYVFAIRRSGHHAIINWLMPYLGFNVQHKNNCEYKESGEFYIHSRGDNRKTSFDVKNKWRRLINFEDPDLSKLSKLPKNPIRIIVLRDPYNNYASRLQFKIRNLNKIINWMDFNLWIQFAKEFIGETNFIGNNCLKINYNEWFKNIEYRRSIGKKICSHFKTEYFDNDIEAVRGFGGGSSFDGLRFNGKASKMKVLERWKTLIHHKQFEPIIKNKQIAELTKKIFKESIID